MNFHILDIEKTIDLLVTSPNGLSHSAAEERLLENGPNEIAEYKKKTVWQMLLQQFADFMILVLIGAAIIAGAIGDATDSIVILIIIILNAIIGFVQEFRAEKAMDALKKMVSVNANVMREGGVLSIPSAQLVIGDIILLETGNIIPADIRLIEVNLLKIEEASLTGESHPVEKSTATLSDESVPLGDRKNMAYKSTFVTYGRAKGIVVATAMDTELGKIAGLLQQEEIKTPLQKRLAVFGKKLAFIVLIICTVFFGVGVLRGEDVFLMLLTAISLAVAAIPEALPAIISIALAIGAKRMIRQNALIRNLPAAETLGSVTYICSDKTGTLTVNKMSVQVVFSGETDLVAAKDIFQHSTNEKTGHLLTAMSLSNDIAESSDGTILGDPTEVAFYNLAKENQFIKRELEEKLPRVAELPFDSERKCMTTMHQYEGKYVAYTKGALDVLLEKSVGLSNTEKEQWTQQGDTMAAEGLRVLGFAMRSFDAVPEQMTPDFIEKNLTIIGIAGLIDPPREEVKQAILECKTAGIKPVMITGDYPLTAKAIAKQLGIIEAEGDLVVTGMELSKMSSKEFEDKVEHIKVYARVSPEQKLNIVKALQDKGQFVAMTGDGVNDAPSLKRADIGVAMGITGTDVSKEAADMILLDDNFSTIVKSVQQGRRIFDNIRKFIKYTMTSNSGEIWTIFLAPFFGLPIPLLPIHILWINLVTDGLPGLALASEPSEKGIMSRPPRHPKESIFANGLGTHILWVGLLMGIVSIGTQAMSIKMGSAHWQTMVFTVLCFSQMGHVFAIRSERQSFFAQGPFSNLPLLGAVLLTFGLQMATIYVPFLNPIFKTAPLTFKELMIALALSSVVFIAVEIEKVVLRFKKDRVLTASPNP